MAATDSQATLIAALLDPRRYPHPVGRVERVETHSSNVLLAGDYAYKVKKPVALSFLDFSSLERRAFFCAEEVRLNRRLAPDIYLDRVAITGTPDEPVIGGDGVPIEYAVRMRRFPANCLLAELLTREDLPLDLMDRLGARIAQFHAEAAAAPADSDFGTESQLTAPVKETLRDLRKLLPARERARVARLDRWVEAALAELAPRFRSRRDGGLVRECHGDLHLGNMALWDDRLVLFDGIEFDPDLRWIDVMNDLAFALMDLRYRRATAHGNRLRNAYLEYSGDYAGLGVLRFYQLYRALVRGKVAAVRASQLPAGDERQGCVHEASDYLRLAESYTASTRPTLVLTCGLSGSGKTTAAQELVDACGFIRIRSDVERKRLFGLGSDVRTGAGVGESMYRSSAHDRTYRRLLALARDALLAGERVVVDAAFLRRAQRAPFRVLADELRLPFALLRLDAAPDVLQGRVADRLAHGADASEATLAVLAHQRQTVEWPAAGEREVISIATDQQGWQARLRQAFGQNQDRVEPY